MTDRPLECSECSKPIKVRYTEIVGKSITCTEVCEGCPWLEKRLKGELDPIAASTSGASRGVVCGTCGTSFEEVKMGNPLGCAGCYDAFSDLLVQDLALSGKLPQRLTTKNKGIPLHLGKTPGNLSEVNPSAKLLALTEALNERLSHEDYEGAAKLRDQIKAIKEKVSEPSR